MAKRIKLCMGCKALRDSGTCELGYKNESHVINITVRGIPEKIFTYKATEKCPKPTTWKRYIELRHGAHNN